MVAENGNGPATVSSIKVNKVREKQDLEAKETVEKMEKEVSTSDVALVMSAWNALLERQLATMECFFCRLFVLSPELEDSVLGYDLEASQKGFFELFQKCVQEDMQEPTEGAQLKPKAEYLGRFASIGMRPHHWLSAQQALKFALQTHLPGMEDAVLEDLKLESSAIDRWFCSRITVPAIATYDGVLEVFSSEAVTKKISTHWYALAKNEEAQSAIGEAFYKKLFTENPAVLAAFASTNMDILAAHLIGAISRMIDATSEGPDVLFAQSLGLYSLGELHRGALVPSMAYPVVGKTLLELLDAASPLSEDLFWAWGHVYGLVSALLATPMQADEKLIADAEAFFVVAHDELKWDAAQLKKRVWRARSEISAAGTYTHTPEELELAARLAWKNSNAGAGEVVLRDRRHLVDHDEIFADCVAHIKLAAQREPGSAVVTVFEGKRPDELFGTRFWNSNLVGYAGWGNGLGDPANAKLTEAIESRMDWEAPETKGAFDVLPVVLQMAGEEPVLFEIPPECVNEVEIKHPDVAEFADSWKQRCPAVPTASNLNLSFGGIEYNCCLFSGWTTDADVAKDLIARAPIAEEASAMLGLSEGTEMKDDLLREVRRSVVHSFGEAGYPITTSPADQPSSEPSPPLQFRHQSDVYIVEETDAGFRVPRGRGSTTTGSAFAGRRILILYGSETYTAAEMAQTLANRLSSQGPEVAELNEFGTLNEERREELAGYTHIYVITSTFGNGAPPTNASFFLGDGAEVLPSLVSKPEYAVLALGNSIYPDFCDYGKKVDAALKRAGARKALNMVMADELEGQLAKYREWEDLIVTRLLMGMGPEDLDDAKPQWTTDSTEALEETPETIGRCVQCPVVEVDTTTGASTTTVTVDLSKAGLTYNTGDILSVHPRNPYEWVDRMCAHLSTDENAVVSKTQLSDTGVKSEGTSDGFPLPSTLGTLLSYYFDLVLSPTMLPALVEALLAAAPEGSKSSGRLAELAVSMDGDDGEFAAQEMCDEFLIVPELLDEFRDCVLPLDVLAECLLRQSPRFYAISSSAVQSPTQASITAKLMSVEGSKGRTRKGVCSQHLSELKAGDVLHVGVVDSDFHPPADASAPVIIFAPGVGTSAVKPLLEERLALDAGVRTGKAYLYTEAPAADQVVFGTLLDDMKQKGVLESVRVAVPDQGKRIQDLIADDDAKVWELLQQDNLIMYVCGDAAIADETREALVRVMMKHSTVSRVHGMRLLRAYRAEGRAHVNLFGVIENVKDATAGLLNKRRKAAAKLWFDSLNSA